MDSTGLVIDIGGQDIILEASQMAPFITLSMVNYNETNAAVTTLGFVVETEYLMVKGDTLNIVMPKEIQLSTV